MSDAIHRRRSSFFLFEIILTFSFSASVAASLTQTKILVYIKLVGLGQGSECELSTFCCSNLLVICISFLHLAAELHFEHFFFPLFPVNSVNSMLHLEFSFCFSFQISVLCNIHSDCYFQAALYKVSRSFLFVTVKRNYHGNRK